MKFLEKQNCRDRKQNSSCLGLGVRMKIGLQRTQGAFLVVGMLSHWTVAMAEQLCFLKLSKLYKGEYHGI